MRTVASVFIPVQVTVIQKQKSFADTNEVCKMWPEAQELISSRNLKSVLAEQIQMHVYVARLEIWDSSGAACNLWIAEVMKGGKILKTKQKPKQNQKTTNQPSNQKPPTKPKTQPLGQCKIFSLKLILDMCVFKRVFKVA